jgi:hypothetical protein
MDDDAPVRWWRVASYLIRPGLILVAGAVPAAALWAWLHWGSPGMGLTALAGFLVFAAGAAAIVGAALLVFSAVAVAIGRVQWAIYTRRALRRRRAGAPPSPYR